MSTNVVPRDRTCRTGAASRSAETPRPTFDALRRPLRPAARHTAPPCGTAARTRPAIRPAQRTATGRCDVEESHPPGAGVWPCWSQSAGTAVSRDGPGCQDRGTCSVALAQPTAASATRRWSSTAPQLKISSRPVLSVACINRRRSAHSCSVAPLTTQLQGWLLCSEGARFASITASRITSEVGASAVISTTPISL